MSYTKGGWFRNIPPATKYAVVFAGRNTHVAVVCSQGLPPEEVEANCSLIAAAPDCLEALEEFVGDVQSAHTHGDGITPDAFDLDVLREEWPDLAITYEKAVKAISKARRVRR